MNTDELTDEFETISYADAGRIIGVNSKAIGRLVKHGTLDKIEFEGLRPRLNKRAFLAYVNAVYGRFDTFGSFESSQE